MIRESSSSKEIYDHLFSVMSSQRFLTNQGLGNEVPFYICPYLPQRQVDIQKIIRQLVQALSQNGVRIIEINLYDLSVELLKKRGIWDRILKSERQYSKAQLLELLQGVLDPEHHLVPAIAERILHEEYDVLFISGVGEVYPYIRSHNILNNLQSTAKEKPTVLFFPGAYTHSPEGGASLELFGLLHDDKYYRAFNILHVQV